MKRIVVLLALLVAAPAAADLSPEQRTLAERYFRAASKAYAAQKFAVAVSSFEEAYAVMPLPEIAFSAAQAYRRLYRVEPIPGHVVRAVELYKLYLAKVTTGGRVGDAADHLAELERELEKLKARGQLAGVSARPVSTGERTRLGIHVTLADERPEAGVREVGDAVQAAVPGLVTTIDGKPVEPFALVDLPAGEHVLAARADGYVPAERTYRLATGASTLVEVPLVPKPATIEVKTEPGAKIAVDGRGVRPSFTVEAGRHWVTVLRRGREPFARELTVARGETVALPAPLRMTERRRLAPWFVGGATILGALAVTTGGLALAADGRAEDRRAELAAGNQPASTAEAYDAAVAERDDLVTATWVLGGGAVLAGATGALLYLMDMPAAPERLSVVPSSSGVRVHGRF